MQAASTISSKLNTGAEGGAVPALPIQYIQGASNQMQTTTKSYGDNLIIKSQRLAGFLMLNGQKLHNIKISNDGSNRNVYFFSHTTIIEDLIDSYKAEKELNVKNKEYDFQECRAIKEQRRSKE
ncbi:DUF5659 domain-containing protein [Cohnella soli]|uniref:DUF5659 domain-containing protein n=1 Tax=Cohnella soli TaxID=425005 RepID=A0ABW0HNP7_9BACL